MQGIIKSLLVSLVLVHSASGAVSFTGSYSSNLKQADGSTNISVGTRYIVVVDTANDGFGGATTQSVAEGTTLNFGNSFGGDEIIQTSTASLAGRAGTAVSNQDLDLAPYAGKQFAIYWFSSLTGTTVSDGDVYGYYRDSGWILPNSPGTYDFGSGGGFDYVQNTSALTPNLLIGTVPEPSRMMLLGLGAIGLIMRRRRKQSVSE